MTTNPGIRDWRLGIGAATRVTVALALLAPCALFAQTPSPGRTNPTNSTNPPSPQRGSGVLRQAQDAPSQSRGAASRTNPTNPIDVPVAPIECWWKTDHNAVRVGETFRLTLTCAVLATERASVVVDESSLDPSALHLTPFEIVGGQRFRDILNAPRKFFQYQYTMRVLGEEFFGKEVLLPRLQITYRVQNSLQGGSALQGREAQYSLVPVPIRVLSLVPPGTPDIRDTPADTFGDVETRLFRSNLLLIVASVAFVLAALMVLMLLARSAVKRRAAAATREREVSPFAVLRASLRELGTVRAESQRDGWNGELAGRAASAVRLAGAVALSRPVNQKQVGRATPPSEGQVPAAPGLGTLLGKRTLLSAAVTPGTVSLNGKLGGAELWQTLSQSLGVFTAARYARPSTSSASSGSTVSPVERSTGSGRPESAEGRNGGVDGTALDAALAESEDAVKRLRVRRILQFGRTKPRPEGGGARPTWAR